MTEIGPKQLIRSEWFTVVVLGLCAMIMAGAFYFVMSTYDEYKKMLFAREAMKQEEAKLQKLETFVRSLRENKVTIERLSQPHEAAVQEKILLEPFGAFLAKLSDLYRGNGFFFLEQMELFTCGDNTEETLQNTQKKEPCVPRVEILGKKVFFGHEAF